VKHTQRGMIPDTKSVTMILSGARIANITMKKMVKTSAIAETDRMIGFALTGRKGMMTMTEREKIIKGLEKVSYYFKSLLAVGWQGDADIYREHMETVNMALALLKEQEAIKPRVTSVEQRCGNCNKVIEMDGWKSCPWCGKPILWEAVGRSVK